VTAGAIPVNEKYRIFRDASLPLPLALVFVVGVLLVFLGLLLFPVNLGLIPFSPDGQLGLLLVINAIQIMALGETPLGQFKRSWMLTYIGVAFASMGVVSCIVPGILTDVIRILLGALNLIGGFILLANQVYPMLIKSREQSVDPVDVPLILKKLQKTQIILYLVTIGFGFTTLIPGLVPGLIISGILVIEGLLLFVLCSILQKIMVMQEGETGQNSA